MLEVIGNVHSQMRNLYDFLGFDFTNGENLIKFKPESNPYDMIRGLEDEIGKLAGFNLSTMQRESWYDLNRSTPTSGFWHRDGFNGKRFAFVSWPQPTEFFVDSRFDDTFIVNDTAVNQAINQGAEVKTFELGSVVLMDAFQLHRTNHKSIHHHKALVRVIE